MSESEKRRDHYAEFQAELKGLQERFTLMQPELEVTVRDPALGVEGYVVVWNTGISVGASSSVPALAR